MKNSLLWFIFVLMLIYQHTIMLNTDLKMWIVNNFIISGIVATYCIIQGIKAIRRKKPYESISN